MAISEKFRTAAARMTAFAKGSHDEAKVLRFASVLAEEQEALNRHDSDEATRAGAKTVPPRNPVAGLAFSGGGIRSATFCLGFLQSLSGQAQLLRRFGYLSTVSGGGFTGGWWVAWLARHGLRRDTPPASLFPAAEAVWLDATDGQRTTTLAGKDPVRFLRLFSNYLTPRKGALSQDTWRAIAVITRNLVLTWLSVLPLVFAALCLLQAPLTLLPQFTDACDAARVGACWGARWASVQVVFAWFGAVVGLLLVLETAFWLIVTAKFGQRPRGAAHPGGQEAADSGARVSRIVTTAVTQGLFVALLIFHPAVGKRLRWPFSLEGSLDESMLYSWLATSAALFLLYWPLATFKAFNERRDLLRVWIVRLHVATLVTTVSLAVALSFAAFGDLAWRSTVAAGEWGVAKAGGLAGLALALAGALYSALKAAPVGGGDSGAREQRSGPRSARVFSVILAVSPWLVVGVLGCLGAWLARASLEHVHAQVQDFFTSPMASGARLPALQNWLVICALAGAALAMVMALAEFGNAPGMVPLALGLLVVWVARLKLDQISPLVLKLAVTAVAALLTLGALRDDAEPVRHGRRTRTAGIVGGAALLAILLAWWAIPSSAGLPDTSQAGMQRIRFLLQVRAQLLLRVRDAATLLIFAVIVTARFAAIRRLPAIVVVLLGSATALCSAVAAASLRPTDLGWWDFSTLVGLGGTAVTGALALGWMVDPNLVSLHGFYRDRLVRAYLGASNERRSTSDVQVTDAVEGDDLPLADARSDLVGGPLPLINTTLNLLAAHDLGVVQRRCANFTLSPLHCGSMRTGFRPTREYMSGALTLGGAVAVSGAAASPAMGTLRVSSAQTMLLTLLNIRLGFWAPNPGEHSWRLPQARLWTLATLRELLSQTDETSSYCYLTDGGHFDNTAIYPLVQRACSLIVVVDCGRDRDPPELSDLAQAIRLCRIDFGAEITFPLSKLGADAVAPFVKGEIHYSDEHLRLLHLPADRAKGVIVCIKPGFWLDGKLPADVLQYRCAHAEFPQQSTADQWFDEVQFESYRKIGASIGNAALATLAEILDEQPRPPRDERPAATPDGVTRNQPHPGRSPMFTHST